MCGNSTKTAAGGTIAVLKSTDSTPDISLLFNSNLSDSMDSTTATFQSPASSSDTSKGFERCQIMIHRSGDLRALDTDPRDILHSFPLAPSHGSSTAVAPGARIVDSFELPTRLDLGVGGEGVIGRRVSLVRRTALGARVVGVGIIGWN